MSIAYFVVFGLVAFGIMYFIESGQKEARREDLEREMARFGLELVSAKIWAEGNKSYRHFKFEIEVRIPDSPETYLGSGLFEPRGTDPIISWRGEDPRRVNARGLPTSGAREPEPELSIEQQINMEVAARLDRITGTPGAMLEHDLDGSGHIDSAEWDALRAKVRAEVEVEFERGLDLGGSPEPPSGDLGGEQEQESEGDAW